MDNPNPNALRRSLILAGSTLALAPRLAFAQAKYPSRPVDFIVPWGAGGGADQLARRLGSLIEKDLDIPKVKRFIDVCHQEGILTRGFFMLGFPTERPRELLSTVWFALRSHLTFATFFNVVPQPETPMYELAQRVDADALARVNQEDYYTGRSWYELATGFPVRRLSSLAFIAFCAWALIPEPFRHLGSLEFSKLLIEHAAVAVAPGIGFGEHGDDFVRLALVENEHRIRQAARSIKRFLSTSAKQPDNVVALAAHR